MSADSAAPRPVRAINTSERSPWLGKACPNCNQPLAVGEPVVVCSDCRTPQHATCWTAQDNTCGAEGCGFSAPVRERRQRPAAAAGQAAAARPAARRAAATRRRPAAGGRPAARAARAPLALVPREAPGLRTRAEVQARLARVLGDLQPEFSTAADEVIATFRSDRIVEACRRARSHADLRFDYLRCLSGVDWQDQGRDVVYHLFSTELFHKCTFKVRVPNDNPVVTTVTSVWRGANWHERETAEMFGITFAGHPYPEPLLLQRDEQGRIIPGHILLKSFPLRPPEPPVELDE